MLKEDIKVLAQLRVTCSHSLIRHPIFEFIDVGTRALSRSRSHVRSNVTSGAQVAVAIHMASASEGWTGFCESLKCIRHWLSYPGTRLLDPAITTMSFDRLSSLESQPTTTRRQDDSVYRDDPEFQRFTENLSTRLFELVSNVSRLSNEVAKLGTSRDTERVRERVHNLLEETRDGFKEVGEGIKKAQAWDDLNVSLTVHCLTQMISD